MKVIFLDIDGVLVTRKHLESLDANGKLMADRRGHHLFDPECVENLKRIIDTTNAKIVLSSTWRMFGRDRFFQIWTERNMPGEIIDFTPNKLSGIRGHEIHLWLSGHNDIESIVIIDDDDDMLAEQREFLVQTTWQNGLTSQLADDAISILNNMGVEK